MDTKKFQRATEIMSELKRLHESLESLKIANKLTFSHTDRGDVREVFFAKSPTLLLCRDIAISECKERIAQFEKEFNEL